MSSKDEAFCKTKKLFKKTVDKHKNLQLEKLQEARTVHDSIKIYVLRHKSERLGKF